MTKDTIDPKKDRRISMILYGLGSPRGPRGPAGLVRKMDPLEVKSAQSANRIAPIIETTHRRME